MKFLITTMTLITVTVFFVQCKKSKPSKQDADVGISLPHGYYIIRTKYLCSEGRAFVLGSFSNYESVQWRPFTAEELKGIKEDQPYAANTYVWKLGPTTHGSHSVTLPPGLSVNGGIRAFSLTQTGPDNTIWYLTPPADGHSQDDNTGLGLGPSFSVSLSSYSPEDLANTRIAMTCLKVTDSTSRLASYSQPDWWFFSLPTAPDEVCNNYNASVIWRNSWLCPNSTSMGNAWKSDACAISQLVFEKID